MKEIISSKRIQDQYVKIQHPSGLTMLLCPMEGYSSTFALFATEYGSIDTAFKRSDEADFVTVPAGIAHYLEHKLFESEDGDAFSRYAKTGASANAYTSFDRTAYLFSCSDHFEESLDILLDFVTSPYFTEQTVQKEQGIIGQEIRMYDDDPQWRVMDNLLMALYHNNPVRINIAGTVESIAQITALLLYRCYETFYNLNNMVLCIAGNFSVEQVLKSADAILKKGSDVTVEHMPVQEPDEVKQRRVEEHLPVSMPLFQIGYKHPPKSKAENAVNQILDEILIEIICGESSPLYRRLYDAGLINTSFGAESLVGRDYVSTIFSGESKDPDAVYEQISQEIDRIKAQGVDEELMQLCKKGVYGKYLGAFSDPEGVASMMLSAYLSDVELYSLVETIAQVTPQQVNERLWEAFDTGRSAISIVRA